MTFFEVSAQVLPVLFLALVFDQEALLSREGERWPEIAADLGVIAAFALGEGVCLYVLVGSDTFSGARQITVVCLGVEILGLIVPHLLDRLRSLADQTRWDAVGRWGVYSGVGIAVAAGLTFLIVGLRAASNAPPCDRSPHTVVLELDPSPGVPTAFVASATRGIGAALRGLARLHGGEITVYVRKLGPASGTDAAEVATLVIPSAIEPRCTGSPRTALQRAADDRRQLRTRQLAASRAASRLASLRLPHTQRVAIVPELIVAARLLAAAPGHRWLIVASALEPLPSLTSPVPPRLLGVTVQMLVACRDAAIACEQRRSSWSQYLLRTGAKKAVFLNASQTRLLLRS